MKKIKILHLIKSLGRGGAEMLLPETLKLHDQSRFEFHYIYFLPWKDQMVEAIESAGGVVTCFSANNNIELIMQYPKVLSYCELNQIQLIHCHLPWSALVGRMIYKKKKIPLIYTEHNIQEKMHRATKFLNKKTFDAQTAVIGVSEDVTNSIEKNISPGVPVQTVLNGVNTENFRRDTEKGNRIRKKYGIPLTSMVVGNIAVFREQKNLLDWVKSFKKINDKNPEVYGLLVGAGTQEKEIKSQIAHLGLQEKIILPGLQTDTISFFSAMDIFMMSSTFEGLPIALLEAMSMDCAIVSTKAGGVVEAVRDGIDGLLVDVGSWEALAENVLQLVQNEEERAKFQQASRERVQESFSLRSTVKQIEEIYFSSLIHEN